MLLLHSNRIQAELDSLRSAAASTNASENGGQGDKAISTVVQESWTRTLDISLNGGGSTILDNISADPLKFSIPLEPATVLEFVHIDVRSRNETNAPDHHHAQDEKSQLHLSEVAALEAAPPPHAPLQLCISTPSKHCKPAKSGTPGRPPLSAKRGGGRLPVPQPTTPLAEGDKENLRPPGQPVQLQPIAQDTHKPVKDVKDGPAKDRIRKAEKAPQPSPTRGVLSSTGCSKPASAEPAGGLNSAAPAGPAGSPTGEEGSQPCDAASAAAAEALRLRVMALERRLAEMSTAAQSSAARLRQQSAALRESERRREADAAELRTARRKLGILSALPPSAGGGGVADVSPVGGAELSRHLAGLAAALAPINGDAAAALSLAASALGSAERRDAATAAALRELSALGQLEAGALARCRAVLGSALPEGAAELRQADVAV
jgi:hypothetical protein